MNIEILRNYCLEKNGVTEEMPFGPDNLVFKVMGKMFALSGLDEHPLKINLKCDPDRAVELREEYPDAVLPGYHMNKTHWNTVVPEANLPKSLTFELIDHSYELVVKSLPKKIQRELEDL